MKVHAFRLLLLSAAVVSWPLASVSQFGSASEQDSSSEGHVFADPDARIEDRVEDLLRRLTLEEKIRLLHGDVIAQTDPPGLRFFGGGVERLGIPKISFLDGRQGVRTFETKGREGESSGRTLTTALPSTLSLSCTWDVEAARQYGKLLGEEMLGVQKHVLFAPMINLVRTPLNGRNFENLGEDPILAGSIATAYIQGVQANKVAACACLIVANDYEANRHYTSSNLDERTLREVHLLPYEMAARDGQVWTMMSSNSLLNGIHCAHNGHLLQEIMKDEVGYDGVMLTDWRAAYDPVPAALAGTDMTTGFCAYVFGDGRLLEAVKEGQVPESLIDEKARRVIRLYIRTGVLDPESREEGSVDTDEHRAIARRLATEGMVLLKNDQGLLPLDLTKYRNIMVTGPGTNVVPKGAGSGDVHSRLNVTPLEGLETALPEETVLVHVPYEFAEGDATRNAVFLAELGKGAESADAVIFFATSARYSEGSVLKDMDLPDGQAVAISALAGVNKNVVVVLMSGSAVSVEPWADEVPALLGAWFAGQATGHAIADVLLGKVNPGGKLSFTMAKRLEDYPVHHFGEWPARLILDAPPGPSPFTPEERKAIHAYSGEYKEGVFVGHRWFEGQGIEPRFAFGHGLSYTRFKFSDLSVAITAKELVVGCHVENTGDRPGSEVVQVYVAPPRSSVPRPSKELKGFAKVHLDAKEAQQVEIRIPVPRLSFYDVARKNWRLDAGEYGIHVGNSSRNILLEETVTFIRPQDFASL